MVRFGVIGAVLLVALASGTVLAYSTSISTKLCYMTGGIDDYDVFGMAKDGYGTHYDSCYNATFVNKWRCNNGNAEEVLHECEKGCAAGECTAESPNDMAYGYRCNATVPDRNLQIRGTVDGNKTDTCVNTEMVKKWYCRHNVAEFAIANCPYGCKMGACKRSGEKNGYDYDQYLDISL
jgi:hypothetical protein